MNDQPWWSSAGGYVADILSVLAEEPDQVVARWREQEVTGRDLVASVTAVHRALLDLGVGPGSVVGVLVEPNRPDMLFVRYAAHLRGAAVCYLRTTNPASNAVVLSAADQGRVLGDTGAAVLYADRENLDRARELAAGGDVAVFGPVTAESEKDGGEAEPWDPQRLAVIGFTSGSSGRPKGIRLSGRAWDGSVRAGVAAVRAKVVLLVNTPVSHTVGPMVDATMLVRGEVVLHEDFDAERFLRAVAEHEVTRTFVGTAHLYQLVEHLEEIGSPEPAAAGLSSLRLLMYGGSAAAPGRVARAVQLLGPVLAQGYGTSEGGRVTILHPPDHFDPWLSTTVGRPFPDVQIALRDVESGGEVEPGDVGQVWMRSAYIMDGYWNDEELTGQVLRDGWYATGDIGYCDEKGYLHLLGRSADVVKVRGVKIHPIAVEREMLAVEGIRDVAVYGWRNEDCVESLHCAVVFQPGAAVSIDEIRARVAEALSPAHVPEEIVVLDELPLNEGGKPDKVLLRSKHGARAPAVAE